MPTKLSRFCEAIMEAAWIVALIVVPVFFNIYSSRIFEPDKISIVRSLALIVLFAWLIKILDEARRSSHPTDSNETHLHQLIRFPLAIPVLALALTYLLASILSVSPRVSLWGSYQRLQGLYTTFSYLIIFTSILGNMRRWQQVERLVTIAILASLPISLYGVIQRFKLDPIPWGGDVSTRIAANMGNSIFLAAFLILVFPLAVIRIIETLEAMNRERYHSWPLFIRLTIYLFITALQLISIYLTGSRGPWLGLAASLAVLWLGLAMIWRKRWLSIAGVILATMASIFLIVLNIPQGPLENLRQSPEFNRLGQLLDAESRTGRVRTLIWQGAAELVQPHSPLEYPDGSHDRLNFIRPLIGYGPESMYVAYNPFYPPELTQVEKRNASPDRSHNETWDTLVTSGVLGLLVYLAMFGSLFFYGIKWLGLIQTSRQRNLFLALFIGGGFFSAGLFLLWKGIPYFGVALPFGMVLGALLFFILSALRSDYKVFSSKLERTQAYVLLGLLSAIVAHFIEINFGIAIVSTRTYFWTYSALLLVTGYILPKMTELDDQKSEGASTAINKSAIQDISSYAKAAKNPRNRAANRQVRKKTQPSSPTSSGRLFALPSWVKSAIQVGVICALLLGTMGFLYITNTRRSIRALETVWNSLTSLSDPGRAHSSAGILMLVVTTGVIALLLLSTETVDNLPSRGSMIRIIGLGAVVSLGLTLMFWLAHAHILVNLTRQVADSVEKVLLQVRRSEDLLTYYYLFLLAVLLLLAFSLVDEWPEKKYRNGVSIASACVAGLVTLVLINYSNLRVIQADMSFKAAEVFAQPATWPVAIRIYERANELAPNEDYYYLFLGRAYLEYARSLGKVGERDQLIGQAARDLLNAQAINPLNPDHTANLARLYSLWALSTEDPSQRIERASKSDHYFSRAVVLKPKDAKLWDEWALLNLNLLHRPEEALTQMKTSLAIDPYYDWTYGLLGDYTQEFQAEQSTQGSDGWRKALEQAAAYYESALSFADANNSPFKYNYVISLAGIQVQLDRIEDAIENYQLALQIAPDSPDNWKILETLARLYDRIGDRANAIANAIAAASSAPEDQKSRLQDLISEVGG